MQNICYYYFSLQNHFFQQVDEDWKDLFSDASDRNLLISVTCTEDAVKCLLREFDPQQVQQQQQLTREQTIGRVRLLETAPPPPRLNDPRRGSRVSLFSLLIIFASLKKQLDTNNVSHL